jgi:hypothetical protein
VILLLLLYHVVQVFGCEPAMADGTSAPAPQCDTCDITIVTQLVISRAFEMTHDESFVTSLPKKIITVNFRFRAINFSNFLRGGGRGTFFIFYIKYVL